MFPSTLPTAQLTLPTAVPSLRWGILGAGGIARTFAAAVAKHTGQRVLAIAARELARAQVFAAEHGIARAYGSYAELLADDSIDVVYIATTQSHHHRQALDCIAAGKHILVEKPFTTTAAEAAEVFAAASARGVLAMEAMWTRYLPQSDVIRQLLADGVFGDIHLVQGDFGHCEVGARLWDPADGGALLDLGIYPIAFASMVLGAPNLVAAVGSTTETGVDAQSIVTLGYESGAQAVVTSSILAMSPMRASICGSAATLEMDHHFFTPTGFRLTTPEFNSRELRWRDETGVAGHEGLAYQATALADYVGQGRLDSPLRPAAEVVSDIGVIEQARHQIGARLSHERNAN